MDFVKGVKSKNKRITARLMTLVENDDPEGLELLKQIYSLGGNAGSSG